MDANFASTVIGRKFYESDVPRVVNALESIAESLAIMREETEESRKEAVKVIVSSTLETLFEQTTSEELVDLQTKHYMGTTDPDAETGCGDACECKDAEGGHHA